MCFHCNLCFKKIMIFFFSLQRPSFQFFMSLLPKKRKEKKRKGSLLARAETESRAPLADKSGAEWAQSAGVIQRRAHGSRMKWVERAATPGPRLESRLARVSNTTPELFWVHSFGPCTLLHAHSSVPVLTSEEDRLMSCCCHWQLLIAFRATCQTAVSHPSACRYFGEESGVNVPVTS